MQKQKKQNIPPWQITFTKARYSIHGWKCINVDPLFICVIMKTCNN